MKKSFTCFLLILFVNGLYAQKILFSQDFEGFTGYNIVGWTHQFTGAVPWLTGLPYQVGSCIGPYMGVLSLTNKVAAIPDCGWDYNNRSVLMFTPPISLAADTGVWLKYDSYFAKDTEGIHIEQATVEVSTDSGKTWTLVQDVPANISLGYFTTYYINLSAYNYVPNIWIGFRYDDSGGHMKGWSIDNVQVFVPSHKDLAFNYITPTDTMLSYVALNNGFTHSAQVFNAGLDTVNSFFAQYRQGSNIYVYNVTGVAIPPFTSYNFSYNIPDTVKTTGVTNITAWVTLTGDAIHNNDTAKTTLRGAYFIPKKLVAVEDGTSTVNGYSPKGWVYMNNLPGDFDVCQISVHGDDSDGMALPYYDNYLYQLRWANTPYTYIDRKKIDQDSFFSVLKVEKNYFSFADVSLNPVLNGDSLSVDVGITPAVDLYGDFRLVLVITEDHVMGTSDSFDQRNFYAGGFRGPMGGFESKPIEVPASDMYYNFVARSVRPTPIGLPGMLPAALLHNNTYNFTLGSKIKSAWQHDKLKAIVLLVRNNDSTVLNSNKTYWRLNINNAQTSTLDAGIYPNPGNDLVNLYFSLPQTQKVNISIMDLSGRILFTREETYSTGDNNISIPVNNLATGMYLVSIVAQNGRMTLKLEVIH